MIKLEKKEVVSLINLEERMKKMKKNIWESFFSSILLIIFAFILLFKKEDILGTIVIIVGFIGIILSGFHLLNYFRMDKDLRVYSNDIFQSIVFFFFGGIAILKNLVLADMLTYVLGAYFIYKNANRFQNCISFAEIQKKNFWNYLSLVSVVGILLGILIILNPFADKFSISLVIAYGVLITEVMNLFQNVAFLIGVNKINESKES